MSLDHYVKSVSSIYQVFIILFLYCIWYDTYKSKRTIQKGSTAMKVKLITRDGKNYSIASADPKESTLILMVGVASKASCLKKIRKMGWTLVK